MERKTPQPEFDPESEEARVLNTIQACIMDLQSQGASITRSRNIDLAEHHLERAIRYYKLHLGIKI